MKKTFLLKDNGSDSLISNFNLYEETGLTNSGFDISEMSVLNMSRNRYKKKEVKRKTEKSIVWRSSAKY